MHTIYRRVSERSKSGSPQTNGDNKAESDSDMKMEDSDVPMDVEYVPEQLDVKGPALEEFSDVFARFQLPPEASSVRCLLACVIRVLMRLSLRIGSRSRALERRSHLLG